MTMDSFTHIFSNMSIIHKLYNKEGETSMAIATVNNTSSQDANNFTTQLNPAAKLGPKQRKDLAINVLAKTEPVSHLANKHSVSRKFLYQQAEKADGALNVLFQHKTKDQDVLFFLPV